ncbi:hypothetical protein C9374_002116 [Naegleria lovaniensis]|uniref:Uncharacterized protein n=1 Tax=Naegleria lovaniensis TaxID=51637 RepID=A0AA88GW96_NAELO|nr:uncharacterized protein C9374_002116 [Naegleria lovaniensis]KAG2387081.1 hypothetical protein C9374_002116 [Naegleria lovaniensis]
MKNLVVDERSELLLANHRDGEDDHQSMTRRNHSLQHEQISTQHASLKDINQDVLSVILKFCSETTDIESLKYSCKNLYWLISGGFDLLRDDFQDLESVIYDHDLIERLESLYLPTLYVRIAEIGITNSDINFKYGILGHWKSIFNESFKLISNNEAQIIISWDNFNSLLENIENSCFKLVSDNDSHSSLDTFLTYNDPVLQSQHVPLSHYIQNWKNKYPLIVDTKHWTVNACRLFKKFILHVHVANGSALNSSVVTVNNKEEGHCIYSAFVLSTPEESIDLKKGIVHENFKALYRFQAIKYLSIEKQFISNMILYVIMRHRLVNLMEKTNFSLRKTYSKNILRKLKHFSKTCDNVKSRQVFYNFLCIQDNILRRYKYNVLNGKNSLPKIEKFDKEVIHFLNMIAFDYMNTKEREQFFKIAIQHCYRSKLSISKEWREYCYQKFEKDVCYEEINCTRNVFGLQYEFLTLEFDRTISKTCLNKLTVPLYPSKEVSAITFTISNETKTLVPVVGTVDQCCTKCCSNPSLRYINCTCFACFWCCTCCCCYRHQKIDQYDWVALFGFSHRWLPVLDIWNCFEICLGKPIEDIYSDVEPIERR